MNSVDTLIKLLKFRSITPNDDGAIDWIVDFMQDFEAFIIEGSENGFKEYRYQEVNHIQDSKCIKNLLLIKKFSEGKHLCFAGHIDVVPPGKSWSSDPFNPVIKDNFIYARGSQDMKSGIAAILNACKMAKNFSGTLSILITCDEEGEAKFGTLEVLKYMKSKGILPDFAIVAEPTCEHKFGDTLKIGRRGSINGTLIIKGKQGHVAYPLKCINPVNILSKILDKLAGFYLDNGDEVYEASQIVITDIRGGMQVCNVTPNDVTIMFNVRNSIHTTLDDVKKYIQNLCKDIDYELQISQSSMPFITDKNSSIVKALYKEIKDISGISPNLSTGGGTSDARYFAQFGVEVAEFGVINDRIHAIDERVSISEINDLEKVFSSLISNLK